MSFPKRYAPQGSVPGQVGYAPDYESERLPADTFGISPYDCRHGERCGGRHSTADLCPRLPMAIAALEESLRVERATIAWFEKRLAEREVRIAELEELLDRSPVGAGPILGPVVGRTVVSAPGAAVTVTDIHLSEDAKRALSIRGPLPAVSAEDAGTNACLHCNGVGKVPDGPGYLNCRCPFCNGTGRASP